MQVIIKLILLNGLFCFSSLATATVILPGMTDDFEDGTSMSWIKGSAPYKNSFLSPVNIANDDESNRYLQVRSLGGEDNPLLRQPHSRMVLFNEKQWAGDYSQVTALQMRMKAEADAPLYMRLAIYDNNPDRYSRFVSLNPVLLPADGEWHWLSLSLAADDLVRFRGESSIEQVLSNVSHLRFLSSKEYAESWGVDQIKATLSIDDITAIGVDSGTVSSVPVPSAIWLMISAVLGLFGLSARGNRKL